MDEEMASLGRKQDLVTRGATTWHQAYTSQMGVQDQA